MPAYQFTIQGRLDGATIFQLPNPLPAPSDGGVIKIAVPGNLGRLVLSQYSRSVNTPTWLRALHAEFAAATRSCRFTYAPLGSTVQPQVVPDQVSPPPGNDAPLMRLYTLRRTALVPLGQTQLVILSDTTTTPGDGNSVPGPHVLYVDVEPVVDDEQLGLVHLLEANADARGRAQGAVFTSFQAVAASATEELGPVISPSTASSPGMQVARAQVTIGAAANVGESMVVAIAVRQVTTGVSVLLGSVTIDNTVAANSTIEIPISPQTNFLSTGDVIQVIRTYVAGGAPTFTSTNVVVELEPAVT